MHVTIFETEERINGHMLAPKHFLFKLAPSLKEIQSAFFELQLQVCLHTRWLSAILNDFKKLFDVHHLQTIPDLDKLFDAYTPEKSLSTDVRIAG